MLFNSFHFACFFAILLPLYWALPHRLQNYLLLAASYYFYSCWIVPGHYPSSLPRLLANNHLFHFFWERRFLSLLVLSTVMDYGCGLAVDRIEDTAQAQAIRGAEHGAEPGDARLLQVFQLLRREPAGRRWPGRG